MKIITKLPYNYFMAITEGMEIHEHKEDFNISYIFINKPKKLELPSYGCEFYFSTNTYDDTKLKKFISFLNRSKDNGIQVVTDKDDSYWASIQKFITEEYGYESFVPKSNQPLNKLYGDLMRIKNK